MDRMTENQGSTGIDRAATEGPHRKRDRRAYMRRYQNRWTQHRREIAIDFLGRRCVKCRATENLEIDHIDPATKVSHRIWSWRPARIQAEIAKCRLLCRQCHTEKSADEKRRDTTHGTQQGYKRGCRCHACTKAKSEATRAYRGAARVREQPPCRCQECRANGDNQ